MASCFVVRNAFTAVIQNREIVLRSRVTSLGRLAVPLGGFGVVSKGLVHDAEVAVGEHEVRVSRGQFCCADHLQCGHDIVVLHLATNVVTHDAAPRFRGDFQWPCGASCQKRVIIILFYY